MRAQLILNGKKADRPDVRDAVQSARTAGHELGVRVTWERGDAAGFVAEAAREGVPLVIVGGGDGSVNEVANGLMALDPGARPALGILPLGTANDFATACRVPGDSQAALHLALTGEPRPVDLGRCNDDFFVNVAAGGFGAAVTAETPVELKNFLGGGAYTLMGLVKAVRFVPYDCSIRTADGELAGRVVVGAICNGRQAGGGQPLAPEARLDDGLLDIIALSEFPASAAMQVVTEIRAADPRGEYVSRVRAPWIEVTAPRPIPLNLDGEPFNGTRFRFVSVPGAIRMVLPSDCPCLTP
ncbi:MAG: lipid kinase YegS [Planctomycetota bacterium]|jgi:lipid kinase YegS